MTPEQIQSQLHRIADSDDFVTDSAGLVENWRSEEAGVEIVESILSFMREHPNINFGSPGPLVHFAESFYRRGYEEALINSLAKKPTPPTVWMLNRVINGTTEPEARAALIRVMRSIATSPESDPASTASAAHFLNRLRE